MQYVIEPASQSPLLFSYEYAIRGNDFSQSPLLFSYEYAIEAMTFLYFFLSNKELALAGFPTPHTTAPKPQYVTHSLLWLPATKWVGSSLPLIGLTHVSVIFYNHSETV